MKLVIHTHIEHRGFTANEITDGNTANHKTLGISAGCCMGSGGTTCCSSSSVSCTQNDEETFMAN